MPRLLAFKAAAMAIALCVTSVSAQAQPSDEDWRLLNEILNASNSVSPETAREAYGACVELGKKVAARTDMDETQRIYFEAEVESCISYAMNNGKFSDDAGDSCAHHFVFATKIRDALLSAQNKKGVVEEQFDNLRDRLKRAGEIGPDLGCKGDYPGLIASLPATDAVAPLYEPGIPNPQIMEHIKGATLQIGATQSDDWLRTCRSYTDSLVQQVNLTPVEFSYFEALIENCIATTMSRGNMKDETGDACTHHHLYAVKLAESLKLNKEAPFFNDGYRQIVEGELEAAKRQGPEMGCKQDYEGVKGE